MSWGLFDTTVAFGCNYSKIVKKPLKKRETKILLNMWEFRELKIVINSLNYITKS